MFTGTPQVNIPLYEVKEGNITLPIRLNYNVSTVKPNQYPGWVGLGWNLSAGGCITRMVRGCYDEKQRSNGTAVGFYSNYVYLQNINSESTILNYKDNYLGTSNSTFELMTDEYNFNFGNYSGSFYLNEYGEWIVVSDDDIKVVNIRFRSLNALRSNINTTYWGNKAWNNRFFDSFTLVTPDGKRYTFGGLNATEYSINYYNRNESDLIPTTWYLVKIESPEGYQLTLTYEPGKPICEIQRAAYSSRTNVAMTNGNADIVEYLWGFIPYPNINNWLDSQTNLPYTEYIVDNTAGRKRLAGYLIFPVYLTTITATLVTVNFHSDDTGLAEEDIPPFENYLAWNNTSAVTFSNPFSSGSSNPANQFHVFMPDDGYIYCDNISTYALPCMLHEYMRWRTLRAISIIPTDVNYAKTYYFDYVRPNRRKLSRIAERHGTYQQIMENIWGGVYDCCGAKGFCDQIRFTTPISNDSASKDYRFLYNQTKKFPRYIFASTDHWGYYNGYSETQYEEGERADNGIYQFDESFYETRNPTSMLDIAQAETLHEIIYPTGGKTRFVYDIHHYGNIVPEDLNDPIEVYSAGLIGGGVRISEIRSLDDNNTPLQTKKYYYSENIPTEFSLSPPSSGILRARKNYVTYDGYVAVFSEGGFNASPTNADHSHITYSTVIEQNIDGNGNSQGYIKYRFTNHDTDIWNESHKDNNYEYANVVGYSSVTPRSSKSMERGKIVAEEYYNADTVLVKSKKYRYTPTGGQPLKTIYQDHTIARFGPGLNDFAILYKAYMAPTYTYR